MRVGLELYDTMVSGVRRPNSVLAEKSFSRFSMRYKIGDDVRLVLGEIAVSQECVFELDARSLLLDDMRRLVGRGVEIGCTGEGDVIPQRVGFPVQRTIGGGRLPPNVRLDSTQIVSSERPLDRVEVR